MSCYAYAFIRDFEVVVLVDVRVIFPAEQLLVLGVGQHFFEALFYAAHLLYVVCAVGVMGDSLEEWSVIDGCDCGCDSVWVMKRKEKT